MYFQCVYYILYEVNLSLLTDYKAEDVPLSKLRTEEGECWRKVMDLERTLCFAAAKINRIIYTGNVMVIRSCIYIQIQTYSTCNTLHDSMDSQHQDHI